MGLVTGGLNGRRFRITSELPEGFRELYLEQVRENAFEPAPDASDAEPRCGWVSLFDAAVHDFELDDFLFDRYLALSLRVDKKTVNGRYFKIALTERQNEIMEERGLEKLSKDDKEAISEALEAQLLSRALPSVSTVDVAWDIHTGECIMFHTSDNTIELLTQVFEETFAVRPRPERMVDWLQEKFSRKEIVERIEAHIPDSRGSQGNGELHGNWHEDDPFEGAELRVAADFVTWLWLQSESSDGLFRVIEGGQSQNASGDDEGWDDVTETLRRADLTLWLENKLKLVDLEAEESPDTTILLGVAPSTSDAARNGLAAGKRPVEAKLGIKIQDLECGLTVAATPGGVVISGIKMPFEVKKGTDEKVFERMALMDLLHNTVKQLFQQFFLARTSEAWDERVTRWVTEDLAAK